MIHPKLAALELATFPLDGGQQEALYIWDEDVAEESTVITKINLASPTGAPALGMPVLGELQAFLTGQNDASIQGRSTPSLTGAQLHILPLDVFGINTTPFDPIPAGLGAPGQYSHLQPSAAAVAKQPSSHQPMLAAPMPAPNAISLQQLLLQHHQLQLLLQLPPLPAHAQPVVPIAPPQQQQLQQPCWSHVAHHQQLLLPTKAEATSSAGTAATAVAIPADLLRPAATPGHVADPMEVDSCQQKAGAPQGKTDKKKPAPGRRGRPPKVAGEYSKGYLAIKRHRERKKSEVASMEEIVTQKRQLLAALTAENQQLVGRLQALQSNIALRTKLVLKIDPAEQKAVHTTEAPASSNNNTPAGIPMCKRHGSPGLASPTTATTTSSNSSACSFAAAGAGLACCASSSAPSAAEQEQEGHDAATFTALYRLYVQACAARVMREAQGSVAPAGSPGSPPWPEYPLPFDMQGSLALWQLDTPPTDSGSSSLVPDGLMTLNLDSGRYEPVPEGFWGRVASQVPLHPGQRDSLAAAWELFASGLARLNSERGQLRERLGAAAAGLARQQATPAGAAWHLSLCGAGCGLEEQDGLANEVEASLVKGRAVAASGGWALKQQLDAEQFAKLTVAAWPRLPLMRAVVGCILCRPERPPPQQQASMSEA